MRELLEGALTKVHEAHLQRIDWEILNRDYIETVDNLESIKPQILWDNAVEKQLSSMEDTVGRKNINSNGNGNIRDKKGKEKLYTKGKDRKPFPECKHCGKMHKGECWNKNGKPDSSKSKHNSNPNKRKWMNKKFCGHDESPPTAGSIRER